MKDIYRSLTENDGEAGILKSLLEENELEALKSNPFHITGNDIRVGDLFRLNRSCWKRNHDSNKCNIVSIDYLKE